MKRNTEFKSIEKIGKKRNGQEAGYQLLKNLSVEAFCYVCNKDLVAGKSELIRHTNSSQHARNMKTVQTSQPVSNFVQVASYPLLGA